MFNYEEVTPGPKCYSIGELKEEIYLNLVASHDQYAADRDNIRKKFFQYRDGRSAERLWKTIKEKVL